MEWEQFWDKLLDEHKLKTKVDEMNQVDLLKGHNTDIKEICHCIYEDYNNEWKDKYEQIKDDIIKIIDRLPGRYLHTCRVKTIESLIEKVIRKRHEWLNDDGNKYASINAQNYRHVITDLVGIRLIISYRGNWRNIHNEIISLFPIDKDILYDEKQLLPIEPGNNRQSELPKVYYAQGDDIKQYRDEGLVPKQHEMNYRSIHYTVSFEGVYVEIQVRTIYDEAWNEVDHSYIYKKDNNKSYSALMRMSQILSKLTNLCNDIGEQIQNIYDNETMIETDCNSWETGENTIAGIDHIIKRLVSIEEELNLFRNKMTIGIKYEGGEENG